MEGREEKGATSHTRRPLCTRMADGQRTAPSSADQISISRSPSTHTTRTPIQHTQMAANGTRARSPRGIASSTTATVTDTAASSSGSPSGSFASDLAGDDDDEQEQEEQEEEERTSLNPSIPLGDDPVSHPHFFKEDSSPRVDQPLTASVAAQLPRGSLLRRIARAALRADVRASTALHRSHTHEDQQANSNASKCALMRS